MAARCQSLLAEPSLGPGAPPSYEPDRPPRGRSAVLLWPATAGTARVARRSTDLLPQLPGLAGAVRRGAGPRRARHRPHLGPCAAEALSPALATVSAPPGPGRLARMEG
ncbi:MULTISPECIES: hypothetical protein [unclassified Streptomyces]|uniref:Uncharacterized protein n=1 Tax=Streptomyces sp. NBC_00060 TaxID=2975636 RepID=A0AAU2H5T7_9ACTN